MGNYRVVVDTNVLVSSLVIQGGVSDQVVNDIYEYGDVLRSDETFSELNDVLSRKKFDFIPGITKQEFIEAFRSNSDVVEITHTTDICRDHRDNKFLELAVSGDANTIISGDNDLLDIKSYQGIEILSPSQFLERQKKRENECHAERINTVNTTYDESADESKSKNKSLYVSSGIVGKPAEKLADFVAGAFEELMGAQPEPSKSFTVAQLLTDPKAQEQHRQAQLAERERKEVLDHIAEAVKAGKNLSPQDVRKLSRDDLENIRAHGDAHVEKLVREREEERQRERLQGYGRGY